jgi:hypothetical protein
MARELDLFDIEADEAKARAIAEAEQDFVDGNVHPHHIVRQWLARLAVDPKTPFDPEDYV